MPHALKKYVLVAGLLAWGAFLMAGRPAIGWAVAAGLAAWIAGETLARLRFRFVARGARESGCALPRPAADLVCGDGVLAVHADGGWSLASLGRCRGLPAAPRPLAAIPWQGGVLAAYGERLVLRDAHGRTLREAAFEAPGLRQSYRLLPAPDGSGVLLLSPWFAAVFDGALERERARATAEGAGHFFKSGALAPGGGGMLLAGTHRVEEDGEPLRARWGWWGPGTGGGWMRLWEASPGGVEPSHVRGVQVSDDGSALCVEWWLSGYGFEVRRPDGGTLWRRDSGERPGLDPTGTRVAWESGELLVMSRVDGTEIWRRPCSQRPRLKRALADGGCLVVEGNRVLRLDARGGPLQEAILAREPEHLGLDGRGRLVLAAGARVAFVAGRRGSPAW